MNLHQFHDYLSSIVFIVLMIAMICYWINLAFFNKRKFLLNFGKLSILSANLMLVFILGSRWIINGYFPLSNLYESLLFLTCILLFISIYTEFRIKSELIGAILIPIALLITGFANLTLSAEMQKASPLVPALQSNWLMLHVTMMLLSYASLIMGSLMCILFLVVSKGKDVDLNFIYRMVAQLHNINIESTDYDRLRREDEILDALYEVMIKFYKTQLWATEDDILELGKLKLLHNLDNWSYRIIGLGFPFLTLGIISGGVWANEAWGSYWSWDPKETWALITWLTFATYLHARFTRGWEGRKAAILGGVGFFIIWICYLGVNFLGKGLHSYGWLS